MTHPPDPPVEFRPGHYRHHYKGGLYFALCIVREHDTRRPWVLYAPVEEAGPPWRSTVVVGGDSSYSIRPLAKRFFDVEANAPAEDDADAWEDEVLDAELNIVPRFRFEEIGR